MTMNQNFWQGRRVFLTGHTGFKGSWTVLWLKKMGAIVKGYALPPNTNPSIFIIANISEGIESTIGDVRDIEKLKSSMGSFKPEIVIHMAAQPLVRASYDDPVLTYSTNVIGTVNLLEAVRECPSVRSVVNVTTDKCYENKEWIWGYRENEAMGGHDPYSSSKGCSELVTSAYQRSFFSGTSKVSLASARAGNVVGGGDWSEDRLIPDTLSAFQNQKSVLIRNPLATRPWQHVLEPICGYLTLAENLFHSGDLFVGGWNFGPGDSGTRPVDEVVSYLVDKWPGNVSWESDENQHLHEAKSLKLDISKSRSRLNWSPKWELEYTLDRIIDWQQAWLRGNNMREISLKQIDDYELTMKK